MRCDDESDDDDDDDQVNECVKLTKKILNNLTRQMV